MEYNKKKNFLILKILQRVFFTCISTKSKVWNSSTIATDKTFLSTLYLFTANFTKLQTWRFWQMHRYNFFSETEIIYDST